MRPLEYVPSKGWPWSMLHSRRRSSLTQLFLVWEGFKILALVLGMWCIMGLQKGSIVKYSKGRLLE